MSGRAQMIAAMAPNTLIIPRPNNRAMTELSRDIVTAVLISHRKNRINNRLRFGTPRALIRLGWHRQCAVFNPGQMFGYIRWRANQYGTQDWRLLVCRAGQGGTYTQSPGVIPAAELLLSTRGSTQTKRALSAIDALEKHANGLEYVTAAYWRHLQNRLLMSMPMHEFSTLQSSAFEEPHPC